MPRENTDAVYRCPKGGLHKWGGRKTRWWIIAWITPLGKPRITGGNTRRCRKCGTMMSNEGIIDPIDE